MGAVEQSNGAIESQLSVLEEAYDSFPVNQRTVTVPTAEYERRRERNRAVELYIKVRNERSEVLHLDTDHQPVLPSTTAPIDAPFDERLQSTVEQQAGVQCHVEGLSGVTILSLRDKNDADRETVYCLGAMFDAEHSGEADSDGAVWQEFDPGVHPAYL